MILKPVRIYCCEDSLEGIFTAVYDAWSSRYGHEHINIKENKSGTEYDNLELFSEYITVENDTDKAQSVVKSIKEKISIEAYEMVYRAGMSGSPGKADAIYRFLIVGFHIGPDVIHCLSQETVNEIFVRNRNVYNEVHHYIGFVRFIELRNSILVARIRPFNDILAELAPHFEERIGGENWMIYDEIRQVAAIYRVGFPWFLTSAKDIDQDQLLHYSDNELQMQALWTKFTHSISIVSRENKKLQTQHLPLRFREYLPEFRRIP